MHARLNNHHRFFKRFSYNNYPGAAICRDLVATGNLAVTQVDPCMQNAVCGNIIKDLLWQINALTDGACKTLLLSSVINNGLANEARNYSEMIFSLEQLNAELAREFKLRCEIDDGWYNLIGSDYKWQLRISVDFLNIQVQNLNNMIVTSATRALWQELAIWFEGKYQACLQNNSKIFNLFFSLFTCMRPVTLSLPFHYMAQAIQHAVASAPLPPQPSAPPFVSAPPLTEDEFSRSSEDNARMEFECPVSVSRMKAPAICLLDGVSYEAARLQESMTKYGKTPTNISVALQDIPKVMRLNTNLMNAIRCYNNGESEDECYRCPITKSIMRSAMFCVLDKLSYEESAISAYLQKHNETPSGIKMPDNLEINDVLCPNRTLRMAIERYLKETVDLQPLPGMKFSL